MEQTWDAIEGTWEKRRWELYLAYCRETGKLGSACGEDEARKAFLFYQDSPLIDWVDIFPDEEVDGLPVGFLIVSAYPGCHYAADRHFGECYVLPAFRRRGLLKKTVSHLLSHHPGRYSADIAKGLEGYAGSFWEKMAGPAGYSCFAAPPDARLDPDGDFSFRLILPRPATMKRYYQKMGFLDPYPAKVLQTT